MGQRADGANQRASKSEVESDVVSRSPWQTGLMRFSRNKVAIVALWLLIIMYVAAAFAEFVAPYSETRSNRRKFFHPPTTIHFFDDGKLSRPYVYNYEVADRGRRLYAPDTSEKYYIRFFVEGEPYKLLGFIPMTVHLYGVDSPAVIYPLGGDKNGRDIFSRILYGARKSLYIGIVGISISIALGLIWGGVSGYFGGQVDNVMMRIAEIIIAVPAFYLLLALSAALPTNIPSSWRFFYITLILSFISWASTSRVIRGMVLSIKKWDFVEGAAAIGCGHWRIITRHILPGTLSYVVVVATLGIPAFILGESGLSLIGVGIQEPQASWGNMLRDATNLTAMTQYPWILVPGVFIFVAVLAWNFVGDAVRDAFDPRSQ